MSKQVWKIENFSCLKGKLFVNPYFTSYLRIKGLSITQEDSEIVAQLTLRDGCSTICSITLLDSRGTPLIHKVFHVTTTKTRLVFPNETKYFPNDTLRVECCMWPSHELSPVMSEFCFAFTSVEPKSKMVRKIFHPRIFNFRGTFQYDPFIMDETIWSDQSLNIKIFFPHSNQADVCLSTSAWFSFRAKIKVFARDTTEKLIEFGTHDALFTSAKRSSTFHLNASREMFLGHETKFLPSDTLSLVIDCKFSGHFATDRKVVESDIFSNIPTTDDVRAPTEVPKSEADETDTDYDEPGNEIEKSPPNTIIQSLQDILEEGYLSDFNLKVGERTFPVHKNVLGARSKVFRSLFASEMKEMQDDCMDIKDIDVETLQRLLKFIYTDRINKDLDWAEASSLYAAADFYALDPLKQICSEILMDGLCATSTLGVLSMADLHQDQQLKSAALDFISLNDEDIIGTEDWIKFEKDNGNLALETFRELYSRKMKR